VPGSSEAEMNVPDRILNRNRRVKVV
jgi:hypothetical protein